MQDARRFKVAYGGRPDRRTEDRAVPGSAREPRRRADLRPWPAARLLQLHGAFALQLADRCDEVDRGWTSPRRPSPPIERNAALNEIEIDARAVNVFDHLRSSRTVPRSFDTIVLDPPAFAKNKKSVTERDEGLQGHQPARHEAAAPRRHLVTASCSYHVDDEAFLRGRQRMPPPTSTARWRSSSGAARARDHPVRLGMPETGYLKCLILRKLDG